MSKQNRTNALPEVEALKGRFGEGDTNILRALKTLSKAKPTDAESLIRLHETLLFLRAYPHTQNVLKLTEQMLKSFPEHVSRLRETEADLSPLDDPEVSGIAGTSVTSNFSYKIVRWCVAKYVSEILLDCVWLGEVC